MATAYVSKRFPVGFQPKTEDAIQNGSLALASTMSAIAENQHWLGMGDLDLVNFHQGLDIEGPVGALSNLWNGLTYPKTLTLNIPPFHQYAAFHFLVCRDYLLASPTLSGNGIKIECATSTSYINNITFGEDFASTAKPAFDISNFGWVHAATISETAVTGEQSALKLNSTASETWTTVDVTITLGTGVYCLAAAYHLLPNQAGYTVTV